MWGARLGMKSLALLVVLALGACVPYTSGRGYSNAPMYLLPITPDRLVGAWYEVASFPGPFQAGCSQTTAIYSDRGDGTLGLINRCVKAGREIAIAGVATPDGPGKFKIKLDGVPFKGDYWVIGASPDGRMVLVGTPTRIAGWVLRKDTNFSEQQSRWAQEIFAKNGYDAALMLRTDQR